MYGLTHLSSRCAYSKTTLLNHLLKSADRKIGVLVNNFGSINVDAEMIELNDGVKIINLANACVCCSVRSDMMQSVLAMAKDRSLDHMVVKASGVADPMFIFQAFLEREIRKLVLVDGVMTDVETEQVLLLGGPELKSRRVICSR